MENKNQTPVLGIIGGSGVYDIEGLSTSTGSELSRRLVKPLISSCLVSWMGSKWCFLLATLS